MRAIHWYAQYIKEICLCFGGLQLWFEDSGLGRELGLGCHRPWYKSVDPSITTDMRRECAYRLLSSTPTIAIYYYELDWPAAVAQPKCTEVPNYPHNCHAIPIFVHHIGLLLAIHWQHSFVQNTAKVCSTSYTHRWVSAWQHFCVDDVCSLTILYKKSDVAGIPTMRRRDVRG